MEKIREERIGELVWESRLGIENRKCTKIEFYAQYHVGEKIPLPSQ